MGLSIERPHTWEHGLKWADFPCKCGQVSAEKGGNPGHLLFLASRVLWREIVLQLRPVKRFSILVNGASLVN